MGLSKNDFTRRERPFNHNANLFSYLSEISKNSEIDITVSAPKKEKDEKDNHKPKQGKKPSKKEKELAAPKEDEPADIQPPTTYTDSEIDAAFGSAVAEPAPSLSGDEETSGCGFLVEEKVEVEESVDEVQNNEESPQGENTNVKEEVAINGIE
jgi:hypothetical protein